MGLLCLWIVETDTLEHHGVNATQDELRLPLRAHIRSQQPEEILTTRHHRMLTYIVLNIS